MEPNDLREAVQEPVILFREGHTNVEYVIDMPAGEVTGLFDRRLISQAVTNLVKNATEAVETAAESAPADWKGQVETRLLLGDGRASIEVIDNGIGLPKHNRSRLLEPYVATRATRAPASGWRSSEDRGAARRRPRARGCPARARPQPRRPGADHAAAATRQGAAEGQGRGGLMPVP
jgi:hypothetical protein